MFLIIVILGVSLIVLLLDTIFEKHHSLSQIEKETLTRGEKFKNFMKKTWLFIRNLFLWRLVTTIYLMG